MVEIVKMSAKGQLVVPKEYRKKLGLKPSELFAAVMVKDGIFFKKIKLPDIEKEFRELVDATEKEFKRKKITKRDIKEAVRWARQK
ncbi:MAG: AbrB/MazE/SpoVT family DNA-binding domain-containing protein [Candidatus Diapherotrites archaeon]|nr:AbrB/MazE/SpoVT family DNA-binding domain-containing protein [Candidatus Diapherotrites archaeon]